MSTKDGVTVARHIKMLHNPVMNIGSKLLIDAADRTNEESGDGTTSCTVIARAFIENASKYMSARGRSDQAGGSFNPASFRRGVQESVQLLCKEIDSFSTPVTSSDQVYQVGMVASNHDKRIADILVEIYENEQLTMQAVSIGGHGSESSFRDKACLDIVQGYSFD